MSSITQNLLSVKQKLFADPWPTGRREISIRSLDPAAWLAAQTIYPKIYWSGRDGSEAVAAVGCAALLAEEEEMESAGIFYQARRWLKNSDPRLRFYGGIRFDPLRPIGSEWADFGQWRFCLPRFELVRRGSEHFLALNTLPGESLQREEIESLFRRLLWDLKSSGQAIPVTAEDSQPERHQWRQGVEQALAAFRRGELEKVVLSRRQRFLYQQPLSSTNLLHRLADGRAPLFRFYFQFTPASAFFGGSPEQLFTCRDGRVETEALAGTRPRNSDPQEDRRLAKELLDSAKDLNEHRWVSKQIAQTLEYFCSGMERGEEEILSLSGLHHLRTPFSAKLKNNFTDADLLAALHPTPAVGGYPREKALAFIRSTESFDRGWFCGPVGWIASDSSQFAVAIRSALIHGREAQLSAGAGIVPGSQPEAEWEETENKMAEIKQLFRGT